MQPWTVTWKRGLPVTPVAVSLRDIASSASDDATLDIVQHALRRRQVALRDLEAQLGRGLAGAARLRRVIEQVAPGFQVTWERLLHRALIRRGVRMTPQTRVLAPDGRVAYLDLGREDLHFGVEIDGFVNHMARFAADRRRQRLLAVELGWTIATYAASEVSADVDAVAAEVAREVRRRELINGGRQAS